MEELEVKEYVVIINGEEELEMDFEELAEMVNYDDEILSLLNQLQSKEVRMGFFSYDDNDYRITL